MTTRRAAQAARLAVVALLVSTALARPAAADRKVFLNGVDLADTAVTDRRFESCQVRFDADGHVHITVPGFDIRKRRASVAGPAAPDPAGPGRAATSADEPDLRALVAADPKAGKVSSRYFLVSKQARVGLVEYDVAVHLNGQLIKVVRSDREPVIMEITRLVRPGLNQVKLVATKRYASAGKRRSFSAADELQVIIGEARVEGATVVISKPLVDARRTAAETRRFTESYQFAAR